MDKVRSANIVKTEDGIILIRNGVMQKGFVQLPGKTVYYNGSGVMQYGEQKISDAWYYLIR